MAIVLHHHPWSRAANVIWMLEELGLDYELRFVDISKGEQKTPEYLALNPMGKIPTLVDGDVVVVESAAIGMYLADKYGMGTMAPAIDEADRAAYLRWMVFGPSVIEPGCAAKTSGWKTNPASIGWGTYEAMVTTIEQAIGDGPWLLGDRFTMADVCMGGTMLFMLQFGMLDKTPTITAYADRLKAREAYQRNAQVNQRVTAEHRVGK